MSMTKKHSVVSLSSVDAGDHPALADFNGHPIRSTLHDGELHFVIVDVIEALGVSLSTSVYASTRYWNSLKSRISRKETGEQWIAENIVRLKVPGKDGKRYTADTANAENLLRIVQSISSPTVEPLKQWLASAGYERLAEEHNPSLGLDRVIRNYRAKGYDDGWIQSRIQGKDARLNLTGEWHRRGIQGREYAYLTSSVHQGTFGISVESHYDHKNLTRKRHNLRDNMTRLELALTLLAEESAAQITVASDAQGFQENQQAAIAGGSIAGNARKDLESKGVSVVSSMNHLPNQTQRTKLNAG